MKQFPMCRKWTRGHHWTFQYACADRETSKKCERGTDDIRKLYQNVSDLIENINVHIKEAQETIVWYTQRYTSLETCQPEGQNKTENSESSESIH